MLTGIIERVLSKAPYAEVWKKARSSRDESKLVQHVNEQTRKLNKTVQEMVAEKDPDRKEVLKAEVAIMKERLKPLQESAKAAMLASQSREPTPRASVNTCKIS